MQTSTRAGDGRVVVPGRHMPALDGLRGLAVIAVVLYHLWPEQVPGGWLGVGLFFTLSGFLVIGLLNDELATGDIDYARFYRRRVRRLLPAALLTILAVVVFVVATDDSARDTVARDGFWAVLNLANWNQMADSGGYAAIFEQSARPLGHMWSLAIEEQFYLAAPLLIGLTRRPLAVVVGGLVVAAIAQIVWWGSADAYLATPVRVAEILAGGALALALRDRPASAVLAKAWPLAALAGLVAVVWVGESDAVVTRGFPALMAVAWVAVIAACVVPGPVARVLAHPALRWVGLRSYAIYLIHWPLIELTDWNGPLVIAVTLLAAEASFRLVEDPVRRAQVIRRPLVVLVGFSVVAAVGLGVASASFEEDTFLVEPGFAEDLPDWFDDPVVAAAIEEQPTAPTTTVAPQPPVVVILGDSTATQIAAGLRARADLTQELAVVDRSTSGCSALIDRLTAWRTYRVSRGYLGEFAFDLPCRVGLDETDVTADLAIIVDHGSVLADHARADGTWASILDDDVRRDLRAIYRARIAEARDRGITLALTTAPPIDDSTGLVGEMDDPARLAAYNALVRELVDESPGVYLVDLGDVLDRAVQAGTYARPDGLHLEVDAAEQLAADVLIPALLDIARSRAS